MQYLEVFFEKIGASKDAAYVRAGKAIVSPRRLPKDSDARFDFTEEHDRDFRQVDRKFEGATEESIFKLRDTFSRTRGIRAPDKSFFGN